ncbi:MAG: hypothetical protein WBC06_01735 [Chitinophagaceae bacterium]
MPHQNIEYQELIKTIYEILKESEKTYRNYLEGGKTFRYAKILKQNNSQLINLLKENRFLLNSSQQKDADELLFHFNTWLEKWNKLATKINPADDDIFVFANEVTFPKHAAQNLESAYHNLKNLKTES